MTTLILEKSVPEEGTVLGRFIGIYTTDAHAGRVLMLFEKDETAEHGAVQIAQWELLPFDPVKTAQEILHDNAEQLLIKAGIIKRYSQ